MKKKAIPKSNTITFRLSEEVMLAWSNIDNTKLKGAFHPQK